MNGDVLMIRVEKNNRNSISPLFQGIDDSMVIAYLQGFMGVAYADRLPNPRFTVIISGEYCFFGGTPDSKDAKELAEKRFWFWGNTQWSAGCRSFNNDGL